MLASTATAAAQVLEAYDYEDLEFRGMGVDVARVWPSSVQAANAFILRVDLGNIGPNVRIVPTARYWASSLEEKEVRRLAEQIILVCERQVDATCPDELDLGQVDLSDLELAVDAEYTLFANRLVSPFFGLGMSLHLLNGRGDFVDGTFVEDLLDTVAPGVSSNLGLNVNVARALRFGIEGRLALAADVRYASVGIGGVWTFPTPGPEVAVARTGGGR